jgi:hypothetical protein
MNSIASIKSLSRVYENISTGTNSELEMFNIQ